MLELADREAISKGITSFQDAGSSFEVVDRVKRAIDAGRMNVRLWMMIRGGTAQSLAAGRVIGYGNNMLTVRAIKITADGALGSRGAWLLEPYSDKADSSGLATTPVEQMRPAGAGGARRRLSGLHPRHRRPRQSRSAEHLRRGVQEERPERQGPALAHRARAAHLRRRHSAVRPARRHRRRCRACTARRTRRGSNRASARSAPKKAPTSGRSS